MLLAFTLSNAILIPVCGFVAFGALAWLVLGFFLEDGDRAEQRLQELSDPRRKAGDDKDAKKSEAISRVLKKASPTLAKPLTPTNEKEMGKLRQDLIEAGFRTESAPLTYLAIRAICSLVFKPLGSQRSPVVFSDEPRPKTEKPGSASLASSRRARPRPAARPTSPRGSAGSERGSPCRWSPPTVRTSRRGGRAARP